MSGVIQLIRRVGALPPHEFAYGSQLRSIAELPVQVDKILSLGYMDPKKTSIQVSTLGKSGGLGELVSYCSRLREEKPEADALLTSLKEVEKEPGQIRVARLIDILIQYRDLLRDEAKQDEIIVFVKYGVGESLNLEPSIREAISERVRRFGTASQFEAFVGNHCPKRYLAGNINIYPRLIENTSWYKLLDREDSPETQPILEVRFMGLTGLFDYMLNDIQKNLGLTFFHLDGDVLPSV
jgi:hypothetical protein